MATESGVARWLPWIVGLAFALVFVPLGYLDGTAPLLVRPQADFLQHQAGVLAYLHDGWHWPPFHTRLLMAPDGTALIFVDALPGPSFLAKLVLTLTGLEIPVLGWWIFALYLLQPVAMARLLRALGVTAWLPLLAGSLVSLACSWFLWRFGHTALNGHFLLLFGLAYAVEAGRAADPSRWLLRLGLLTLACLFVHAYLFAMSAGLLVVLLAGLVLQRRLAWWRGLAALGAWLALAGGSMALLGYFEFSEPLWGYQRYSMNLLSPFVPQMSGLWPDFGRMLLSGERRMGDWEVIKQLRPYGPLGDVIDATGGQYEGYAWLGFGLWPLLLLALLLNRRVLPRLLARHWPLLLACLGMAFFALGPVVWLAYGPWFKVDFVPEALTAFRSCGRFVWPLVYLAAALAVAGVGRHADRRWVAAALALLTLVQVADMRLWYDRLWRALRADRDEAFPAAVWEPLIAAHGAVLIEPPMQCPGNPFNPTLQLIVEAARVGRSTDSMYLARKQVHPCIPHALALPSLHPAPDALLLVLGPWTEFQRARMPAEVQATCRAIPLGLACSALWDRLAAEGLTLP